MHRLTSRHLRVLAVLGQLAQTRYPQTLSQLAQRLHIPKASLMRLLATLVEAEFVTQIPGSHGFTAGPRAADLALGLLRGPQFSMSVRGVLAEVVQATGESCNLTALERDHMRYIERVETAHPLRLTMAAGDHVPLHCTATGKLALALMAPEERNVILDRVALQRYTAKTIIDREALIGELDAIHKTRVGVDREEFVHGMVAVAVPVSDNAGLMAAALSCHGPTARVSMRALQAAIPMMRTAATKLGILLGNSASPGDAEATPAAGRRAENP